MKWQLATFIGAVAGTVLLAMLHTGMKLAYDAYVWDKIINPSTIYTQYSDRLGIGGLWGLVLGSAAGLAYAQWKRGEPGAARQLLIRVGIISALSSIVYWFYSNPGSSRIFDTLSQYQYQDYSSPFWENLVTETCFQAVLLILLTGLAIPKSSSTVQVTENLRL